MKKYFLLFSIVLLALSSCKKGFDQSAQNAKDDAAIQAYLKTNNITATKDASGLYYQIIAPGTGAKPTLSSALNVSYTGYRLDGSTFDQAANTIIFLNSAIDGWQIGVPKIAGGGEIKLFIPSVLAYGNNGSGVISPNTVLVFDIQLITFSN
jgi:FKBP-type peptidyl-prolyl cis-trans isomerase